MHSSPPSSLRHIHEIRSGPTAEGVTTIYWNDITHGGGDVFIRYCNRNRYAVALLEITLRKGNKAWRISQYRPDSPFNVRCEQKCVSPPFTFTYEARIWPREDRYQRFNCQFTPTHLSRFYDVNVTGKRQWHLQGGNPLERSRFFLHLWKTQIVIRKKRRRQKTILLQLLPQLVSDLITFITPC